MPDVLIDRELFASTDEGPVLVGSRCPSCATVTFPKQSGCPKCFADDMADVQLPRRGTLWTFTTQAFPPKGPPEGMFNGELEPFQPFTVGYVELAEHCKVEARLTEPDPSKLQIGMEMELVLIPHRIDEEGNQVMTFAFGPVTP